MTTLLTRPSALEALQLLAAVHLHAVLLEHALEEAADLAPNCRSRVTSSCITIEHFTPYAAVRDAATSLADVAAADQHRALGLLGVGADRVRVAERAQVVDPSRLPPSARSRRTFAPVASSALPKATSSLFESFATRSSGPARSRLRA